MEPWQREFAETIEKHRRQGWGWRYDGLRDWTSDAIFKQLRELGIDADAGRFREQAAAAGGIRALTDNWNSQIREEMDTGFWPDFPLAAVPVLWERFAADLICPELIDERIHRVMQAEKNGRTLPDVDGIPADVTAAMGLINYLRGFPAVERADRFKEVERHGIYRYSEWLLDIVGVKGRQYPEIAVEIADVMSDCVPGMSFRWESALLLAEAGRREEAIGRARAMVEKFPDDPWSRIHAGDVHHELGDADASIRLYGEALAIAHNPYDWDSAAARFKEACNSAGQIAEMEEILRRHPSPKRIPPQRAAPSRPVSVVAPQPAPLPLPSPPKRKIGRNDPCPCGSGKKYKKCCLK